MARLVTRLVRTNAFGGVDPASRIGPVPCAPAGVTVAPTTAATAKQAVASHLLFGNRRGRPVADRPSLVGSGWAAYFVMGLRSLGGLASLPDD
jgi:hypothetical protein